MSKLNELNLQVSNPADDRINDPLAKAQMGRLYTYDDYLEWKENPVKWVKDILGLELEKFQKEILIALARERFVCVSAGSGVGKTVAMAAAGLWFLCTHFLSIVPCTAPSSEQLYVILWKEFSKLIRCSVNGILEQSLEYLKTRIEVRDPRYKNEWRIVARTAKVDDSGEVSEGLSGFHSEHILYLIDEASGISDKIFAAIEGSLSGQNSYMLMCSNYTRLSGYFHKCMSSDDDSWYRMTVSCFDSRWVDKKYISRMATRFGEDSDIYRIKVLGLPPKDNFSESVLSIDDMKQVSCGSNEAAGSPNEEEPLAIYVGLDVARYGDDLSVMWSRLGYEIFDVKYNNKMDSTDTSEWVWNTLMSYSHSYKDIPIIVNIDTVGYGAGVYDLLKRKAFAWNANVPPNKGRITISSIEGYKKAKDPMFYNTRSELYFNAKSMIPKIRFKVNHDRLLTDLRGINYTFRNGKIMLEEKTVTKKRLGTSPDFADAFVLCLCQDFKYNKYPSYPTVKDGETEVQHTYTPGLLSSIDFSKVNAEVSDTYLYDRKFRIYKKSEFPWRMSWER